METMRPQSIGGEIRMLISKIMSGSHSCAGATGETPVVPVRTAMERRPYGRAAKRAARRCIPRAVLPVGVRGTYT